MTTPDTPRYTAMSEAMKAYDEMLDEVHGEPMGYPASRILREVDPIAYRTGFHDWLDGEEVDLDSLEDDADLP